MDYRADQAAKIDPEKEQLIAELADAIKNRGLSTPVNLMIEMHRPLTGIGSTCFTLLRPFLGLVVSRHKLEILGELLEHPQLLERLVTRLEE
jgi:hypothetical protein